MKLEELKKELKTEIEAHRNIKLFTGQTSISAMASDCLHAIEKLEVDLSEKNKRIAELEDDINHEIELQSKAIKCIIKLESELNVEQIVNEAEIKKNWELNKKIESLEEHIREIKKLIPSWNNLAYGPSPEEGKEYIVSDGKNIYLSEFTCDYNDDAELCCWFDACEDCDWWMEKPKLPNKDAK